jgi:predicted TIM-barrel fold metal-dependent hydrolase
MNASGARYGAERMLKKVAERPMTPEVVFAFWDRVGVEMGTGVQYNSVYGSDNSYLLDVCKAHPRRALPVVILPPTEPKTPGLLEKWAKESYLTGVRWTGGSAARGYPYLSDAAKDAWAVCNALGLAVVLMPLGDTAPALQQIARFADAYPNVRIALDHIGFPRPEVLPDTFGLTPEHHELAKHRNVYYKLTNFLVSEMEAGAKGAGKPMVALKPFLEHMVGVFGADHLCWGSDYGNVEVDDVQYTSNMIAAASGLPAQQRSAFFYDTARAVFVPGGRGPQRG